MAITTSRSRLFRIGRGIAQAPTLRKTYTWILPAVYVTHAKSVSTSTSYKYCDILIVGSGAAGLVAALRAHSTGLEPLIIEKSSKIGGTSAYSGGGVWVPNNHISRAAGNPDSIANALKYLETIIGDIGPASSRARKVAFLTRGPEMIKYLEDLGFKWISSMGYPDYYPEKPGGSLNRSIEPDIFNAKLLGDLAPFLLQNPNYRNVPLHTYHARHFPRMFRSWDAFRVVAGVLSRGLMRTLIGQQPVTTGKSLVAQLMLLNKKRLTTILRETSLVKLTRDSKRITGAIVLRDGEEIRIRSSKGVLLCAGGFARNKEMRDRYQQAPASVDWTSVPPGDTGDAISAGQAVGAAIALMDDAWWGPTLVDPATGKRFFSLYERSLPHGIIVDSTGNRFMNEATSYTDCGHAQYERNKTVPAIPAWLIVDSRHRKWYPLATMLPGRLPKSALHSGWVKKADSLKELGAEIGVDATGLLSTVERFNKMAESGIDDDFGRGGSAYDRYFGDPKCKPNSNLGSLEKGPFYAMEVWPGDLGTKGGLLTDEYARVLKEDGEPIVGLYAAGNTSASVMGRTYAGSGSTLGTACTFAFIAADHLAREEVEEARFRHVD